MSAVAGFDLTQIEHEILQLLAIAIGSGILWLLKQAISYLGRKLTTDQQHALNVAVDKMMTFGVTKAEGMIHNRGWDHVDSKNAVINFALPALKTKFEETLAASGIDLKKDADRIRMVEMMQRMWPDIATRLSESPATPSTDEPPPLVDRIEPQHRAVSRPRAKKPVHKR